MDEKLIESQKVEIPPVRSILLPAPLEIKGF